MIVNKPLMQYMKTNMFILLFSLALGSQLEAQTLADRNYPPKVATVTVESSNLPLVWITTTGTLSRAERSLGYMKVINNSEGVNYADTVAYPDQSIVYDGSVQIRWRGNSSFQNSSQTKKPMSVIIPAKNNDYGRDIRLEFLAPWQDMSYIRDILTNKMAEGGNAYVPKAEYCEVFVDGIYYGVFILSDRSPKGSRQIDLGPEDWIVEIDRPTNKYLNTEEKVYTSKYHPLRNDGTEITDRYINYQYKDPDFSDFAQLDYSAIDASIGAMEDAFASDSYKDLYADIIDVPSWIDFEIAQEVSNNIDGYRLSTPLWKYGTLDGGQWKMALWDFNIAYGGASYFDPKSNIWRYAENDVMEAYPGWVEEQLIPFYWQRLMSDSKYVKKLKSRYTERRRMSYSDARIIAVCDSLQAVLDQGSVSRDNTAWGNRFKNWKTQVSTVMEFTRSRLTWIDESWYNQTEEVSDIYFDNSVTNWEKVYAYSWLNDGTEQVAWPGIELTAMEDEGLAGRFFEGSVNYPNVIFNDGTEDNKTSAFIVVDGHVYGGDTHSGTCGDIANFPEGLLSGTIIGNMAEEGHPFEAAFDGDGTTYYSSSVTTGGWVGLDLLKPYIITRVGVHPAPTASQMQYGLIEGANNPDFSDALPLWMFTQDPEAGTMTYQNVNVSRAFRYVRYQGPYNSASGIADIEFYGARGKGDDTGFFSPTNLPVVSVYVEDLKEPEDKVTQLPCIISVLSDDGKTLVQDSGTVRLRGNYSTTFPKKPYRIKFDHKTKLLGSPAKAKKWTLIPSYGDKTLMRNSLAFDVSKSMGMEYTPFCTPVNVWFNGDYKGCYQLCDQIEVDKGRVEIEEMDTLSVSGDSLTGGYLIEVDHYANTEKVWFRSTHKIPVVIKSPEDDVILPIQKEYITNHFNAMETDVYNKNFDEENGYQKRLDLPSFVKRHLHQELIGNTDNYFSVYMYKQRGDDHLYSCPVWDMDLAFENDDRTYPLNDKTDWSFNSGGSCASGMKTFVNNILSDVAAQRTMQAEWARLRQTGIIEESKLLELVDMYADSLSQSQIMNFWRWPIMNETIHENPVIWGSYEAEVENVRNYISGRIPWMDNMLSCEQDSYKLTLSSAGWGTLFIPFAASIPTGLKVYTVTGLDGQVLEREEVSMVEPNKPYLVKGIQGEYIFTGFRIPEWDSRNNGLLTGTYSAITAPLGSYVLQKLNGRVFFYKVAEGHQPTVTANKAYLTVAAPQNAPLCFFLTEDFEDISNLSVIETSAHEEKTVVIRTVGGEIVYMGSDTDARTADMLNGLPKGMYIISVEGEPSRKVIRR